MLKNEKQKEEEKNISIKEQEIIELYDFDDNEKNQEEIEEVNIEQDEEQDILQEEKEGKNSYKIIKTITNFIFILLLIFIIVITIDIIMISKYNKGPFFAIPVKTYKDGGTKVYYGIGYKVIKYHQKQGRRDIELGTYSLKYNTNPIEADAIDLAIELYNNQTSSMEKYYKKFARISGELTEINEKNNTIVLSYIDDGGKYNIDIKCSMAKEKEKLNKLKKNEQATIIGTITNIKSKDKKKPTTVYVNNCFVEQ